MMWEYVLAFVVGGLVTLAITWFEASGFPLLSRLAALFPVFTWISYLFIGTLKGGKEVSSHVLFVLLGTIFAWIPYMLVIYYLSQKINPIYAILIAIGVFVILALVFIKLYGLFT